MRDFYDIYILTAIQPLYSNIFRAALKKRSRSGIPLYRWLSRKSLFGRLLSSDVMAGLWKRYQKKYRYASDVTWKIAMDALKGFAQINVED